MVVPMVLLSVLMWVDPKVLQMVKLLAALTAADSV